jgi:transcriptional regulator with XRE-family HTH domain
MAKMGQISQRLRDFAHKLGGPSALARALDVTPQTLNNYLNGRSVPGVRMQERLRKVGCDIEWLMTGEVSYRQKATTKRKVAELPEGYELPPGLNAIERRQIALLIKKLNKLNEADKEKAIRIIRTVFPDVEEI